MFFDHFSYDGPYRLGSWIAQIPLAALLAYRIVSLASRRRWPRGWKLGARIAAALVVTGVLAGLLVVVIIGGVASPFKSSATTHQRHPTGEGPLKMNMPGMRPPRLDRARQMLY